MANFAKAQKIVGINEGVFQTDPRDEGNYYMGNLIGTNWGISAPTLASYLGRIPTVGDMKALQKQTAEEILRINYWLKNNLDNLNNQSVATLIYDGAVNHGSNGMRFLMEKALRMLYKTVGYHEVFTEKGIAILNKLNQNKLFLAIKTARAEKYRQSSKSYALKGHLARLDRIRYIPDRGNELLAYSALVIAGIGLLFIAM